MQPPRRFAYPPGLAGEEDNMIKVFKSYEDRLVELDKEHIEDGSDIVVMVSEVISLAAQAPS